MCDAALWMVWEPDNQQIIYLHTGNSLVVNPNEWIPGNMPNPFVINQRRYKELQMNKSDHLLESVSVSVSVYCLVFLSNNWTVQEKPPKGPVQGDCTGYIPVSDWLLTHNLRSSSSVRNHKGRGEFGQLSSSLFIWQIALLSLGSRFCLYSRTIIKMCPECIHWKTIYLQKAYCQAWYIFP